MLFVDSFPHLDIYLIKEAMILLLNKIASNMACWVFLLQRRTTRNMCSTTQTSKFHYTLFVFCFVPAICLLMTTLYALKV